MSKTYAFLDANIFLHYQVIDQIDWCGLLTCKEVVLMISPVIIRELNKNKDSNQVGKLRQRAGAALKKLAFYLESDTPLEVRNKTTIKFLDQEPSDSIFAQGRLSKESQDDQLLATLLEFKAECRDPVILITADVGLRLKAKSRKISYIAPLESDELSEELSADQLKIKQLEQRLREAQSLTPSVSITFKGGLKRLEFNPVEPKKKSLEQKEFLLSQIRENHSLIKPIGGNSEENSTNMNDEISKGFANIAALMGPFLHGDAEEVASYNRDLEQYYLDYKNYIDDLENYEKLLGRKLLLEMELSNTGTVPAEGVHVHFHYPDGFQLFDEEGFPEEPLEPNAPEKPVSGFQRLVDRGFSASIMPSYTRPFEQGPIIKNVSPPTIKKGNSYDVSVEIQKIRHGATADFDPVMVLFDSYDSCFSFSIDYTISAENMPHPSTGKLHIVVRQ